VKKQAVNAPNSAKWSFDYAKLSMEPIFKAMADTIDDLPTAERFLYKVSKIKERSDARTFADLLDLRQMVNAFRFGRGTKKAADLKVFKELMANIDSAIDEGAHVVMENPKQWLSEYANAKASYAQMKELEKNVLFKAITTKGMNDKILINKMVRYITSGDETWTDVMAQLPAKSINSAEHAVIDALANKFTKGEGQQAVNFPKLAEELNRTTFTTKSARSLKGAINRLADVFKNDTPLLQHSGGLQVPGQNQTIATSIQGKVQMFMLNKLWNRAQAFLPGETGRKASLITKAADLLENPLNVKSAKALMDEVGDSMNLAPDILELQRDAALKAAKKPSELNVRLYGDGKTLSLKGSGKETKMNVTRIAKPEDVKAIAEAEGIAQSDTKAIESALRARGYQAIVKGTDKVKLL